MQHDPYQATFHELFDQRPARAIKRSSPVEAPAPVEPEPATTRMSREQVIDRIVTINTSATAAFLDRFGTASLHRYLEHLDVASGPRGRNSSWQRPGDSPAIVTYESEH